MMFEFDMVCRSSLRYLVHYSCRIVFQHFLWNLWGLNCNYWTIRGYLCGKNTKRKPLSLCVNSYEDILLWAVLMNANPTVLHWDFSLIIKLIMTELNFVGIYLLQNLFHKWVLNYLCWWGINVPYSRMLSSFHNSKNYSVHLIRNNFCAKCIEFKVKTEFPISIFNIFNKRSNTVLSENENFDIGINLSKE